MGISSFKSPFRNLLTALYIYALSQRCHSLPQNLKFANDSPSGQCASLNDCPVLLEIFRESGERALEEYDKCGDKSGDKQQYICPESEDDCSNCIFPGNCPALSGFVKEKRFQELENFKTCGFEGVQKLYCCPSEPKKVSGFLKVVPVTPSTADKERFGASDVEATTEETSREDIEDVLATKTGEQLIETSTEEEQRNNMEDGDDVSVGNETELNNKLKESDDVKKEPDSTTNAAADSSPVITPRERYFNYLNERCGFSVTIKIFGGEDVGDHEYPWLTALGYSDRKPTSKPVYVCGGSIISDQHILTAAHCLSDPNNPKKLVEVRIGHANLTNDWSFAVRVEKEIPHPDYKLKPFPVNDIAILKLVNKLELESPMVMPICLPQPSDSENGIPDDRKFGDVEIAGWGATSFQVSRTDLLQRLNVNVTSLEACEKRFKALVPTFTLDKSKICAEGKFGTDGCKGDSGGPLMNMNEISSKYEVIGVTSFGTKTCDSFVPGLYTRVTSFLDWIKDTMWTERDD